MNKIDSIERALPTMTRTQIKVYLRRARPEYFDDRGAYRHRRTDACAEARKYEIHEFTHEVSGASERFFFDVTPFVNRAPVLAELEQLDLPGEGETTLGSLLPEVEMVRLVPGGSGDPREWLRNVPISFRRAASETMAKHIAAWDLRTDQIHVAPLRDGSLRTAPILHGFHFYKLFMAHQMTHRNRGFLASQTETAYRAGTAEPGASCMPFSPLPPYHFANDFINYNCWTHTAEAFDDPDEALALRFSAAYGVRSGLFTGADLHAAIVAARMTPVTEAAMLRALKRL